jgi:hypothetical protein
MPWTGGGVDACRRSNRTGCAGCADFGARGTGTLGLGRLDHAFARRSGRVGQDGVEAGELENDRTGSLGEPDRDPVDDRRQWNREPAGGEGRHGQEHDRGEDEDLAPVSGEIGVGQAAGQVQRRSASPQ